MYEPASSGRAFELPPPPPMGEGVQETGSRSTALVRLTVGAGTYVRSFARDLGTALGLPAYLSGLVRTASGGVDLAETTDLEGIAEAETVDVVRALELPALVLTDEQISDVRHGRRPPLALSGRTALVTSGGTLVALAETTADPPGYRLLRVFN